MANQKVEYTVRASDYYEYSYYSDREFNSDNYRYGYRWGTQVSSGVVSLDENGLSSFNIDSKIFDHKSKIYTVEVKLFGKSDDVIEVKNILVRSGQFGIFKKDFKYGIRLGDTANLNFILKSYGGASLGNRNLSVETNRTWWEKRDGSTDKRGYNYFKQEEKLGSQNLSTNAQGEINFDFYAANPGSYDFIIKGEDDRGNIVEKSFYMWVSADSGYYYSGENDKGLSISTDKEEYEPGDISKINISSELEEGDLFLAFERGYVHDYRVVSFKDYSSVVEKELKEIDVPNIFISASSFSDYKLNRDKLDVKVSAEGKRLNISMNFDKDKYDPGDNVDLIIKVEDNEGNPQEADLTVWAVDKAIFELVNPSDNDIFDTFWRERYDDTDMGHSLEGININSAEKGGCFLGGTKVLMSDGKIKNIEDVTEGDFVLTRSDEKDGKLVSARVIGTHETESNGYFILNDNLKLTGNHILWVNDSWRKTWDVKVGDFLIDKDGEKIEVKSIRWERNDNVNVYNLKIESKHSYFANGIWVHNGKDGGRSNFSDTAYWNPHVRTGSDGIVKLSFTIPEDLTTWVVSAVGVTKETEVGSTNEEIITTKDIVIRPQLPNILYKNDRIVLTSLAQNFSGEDHAFEASLKFDGGQVINPTRKIKIPAGGNELIEWNVFPEKEGDDFPIEFSLKAEGTDELRDVVQKTISVKKFGYWENSSFVSDNNPKALDHQTN